MPMIELTLPEEALEKRRKSRLVAELTAVVSKWEGMRVDDPRVASTICTNLMKTGLASSSDTWPR